MKTVLRLVPGICLIGYLLAAGCNSEVERPDSVASANRNPAPENPVPLPFDREIIRRVPVTEITKNSPQKRSSEYHRVQPGETLSVIASRYRTTAEQLTRINGFGDPVQLTAGQWLCLPKGDQ